MKKQTYVVKYFHPVTGLTYTMGQDFKFYLATAKPLQHFDRNTVRGLALSCADWSGNATPNNTYIEGPRGGNYPLSMVQKQRPARY